jgi:hypothetical protein
MVPGELTRVNNKSHRQWIKAGNEPEVALREVNFFAWVSPT